MPIQVPSWGPGWFVSGGLGLNATKCYTKETYNVIIFLKNQVNAHIQKKKNTDDKNLIVCTVFFDVSQGLPFLISQRWVPSWVPGWHNGKHGVTTTG